MSTPTSFEWLDVSLEPHAPRFVVVRNGYSWRLTYETPSVAYGDTVVHEGWYLWPPGQVMNAVYITADRIDSAQRAAERLIATLADRYETGRGAAT